MLNNCSFVIAKLNKEYEKAKFYWLYFELNVVCNDFETLNNNNIHENTYHMNVSKLQISPILPRSYCIYLYRVITYFYWLMTVCFVFYKIFYGMRVYVNQLDYRFQNYSCNLNVCKSLKLNSIFKIFNFNLIFYINAFFQ